jgi:hypothetical protein
LYDEIENLDPERDKIKIQIKKEQISNYEGKIDKLKEINSAIEERDGFLIDDRQTKINEFVNKNEELQNHLDENYMYLNERFVKDGMSLEKPGITNERTAPQSPTNPDAAREEGSSEGRSNENTRASSGTAPVAGDVAQPESQNNALEVKRTDKEIAKSILKEFRDKNIDEQRAMMNGYGYTDLVAITPYLGPYDRKCMLNIIGGARDYLTVPDGAAFKTEIEKIPKCKGLAEKWYKLLFESREKNGVTTSVPRDFKKLDVEELREIQRAIELINNNKKEIEKIDPQLLEYFDQNFTQFVITGSLLERVKTGK